MVGSVRCADRTPQRGVPNVVSTALLKRGKILFVPTCSYSSSESYLAR
jgi:hypothetical protein